ncbi:YheV family putative zinc ribbon protein [Chromohalobacter canadensis]|uniref:YheV family putative zinc ribbon protein n=1 Tax=Chromohalobacter canadensis TaxID=141389 RepID=A0ABZ0YEE1_9GAMM|nr:YheV family putative zinc ribbon protein [Chromohalobacter canadensis]MCK0770166.1 YheV family putative metal-binding protein [Chromohalobacter canadensis]WQH10268.1 YheV family putative zinc ribbon protein [Chromohalobacter canadensis]
MTANPKRFIAGAICPRCAAMDRIRAWEHNGIRYRECVSCDYLEQLAIDENGFAENLTTRVNQPREDDTSDDIQTVRLIDPSDGKTH